MIYRFSILREIPSIYNQMEYSFGKFRILVIDEGYVLRLAGAAYPPTDFSVAFSLFF